MRRTAFNVCVAVPDAINKDAQNIVIATLEAKHPC